MQAGCDVLLMPNSLPEAYAAVLEAVQNGTITQERLDQSVNKILRPFKLRPVLAAEPYN